MKEGYYTQTEVAKMLGVSRQRVAYKLKYIGYKERRIDSKTIEKLKRKDWYKS